MAPTHGLQGLEGRVEIHAVQRQRQRLGQRGCQHAEIALHGTHAGVFCTGAAHRAELLIQMVKLCHIER
ncbi:MAG: hypothetical protein CMH65_12980 [Nevskiales bacterium]|nr:hypothetical protein [Nevskiales bacterium]